MRTLLLLVVLAGAMTACTASVLPVVAEGDALRDDRLVGSWVAPEGELATVTAASGLTYDVQYVEKGKPGRFTGRLGRVGAHLVLDLSPADPAPEANDLYRTMLIRTHGILVMDSIGAILGTRMLKPDSLKAYLERLPNAVQHVIVEDWLVLTSSSADTRRFLADYLGRPGVLDEAMVWKPATSAVTVGTTGTAQIRIASATPNAVLYVNGKVENLISAARDVTVPAGAVRLSIRAPSCQPWDTVVQVAPNTRYAIGRRNPRC
ncbi:MAG: hypothetical protein WD825_11600 [Gemmatimonadaceae bacterium]